MRKIPTLFQRDHTGGRAVLTDQVTPGCEWVLRDEGVPTRKYDGTCVKIDAAGEIWTRREVKAGKPQPPGFILEEVDDVTGKAVGWEPYHQSPFARPLEEALARLLAVVEFPVGTYELIGPKVNGNPERVERHTLVCHADAERLPPLPTDFAALRDALRQLGHEGVVWHHPDGRMAKLKVRDFQ